METKIRKVGNSLGVTLPINIVDELHLKDGDILSVETKEGSLKLKPVDIEFEDWADAYRKANVDYKDVLKELAK